MAEVFAAYALIAGTTARVELPESGMDPDLIALYLAEDAAVSADLCHECGQSVTVSEIGDLTSFTLEGVDYERDEETGHWVPAGGEARG